MSAGSLLYWPRLGILAFALLILHGIIDSADGQLARLTNRTSEFGRILDGLGGYATHAAAYLAIALGVVTRGGSYSIFTWVVAAGFSNTLQAQMYDYHRTVYATVVVKGRPPEFLYANVHGWARRLVGAYNALQRQLIGAHETVEEQLRERAVDGRIGTADRERYRASFYWPVRGWNLLGDNTRFYAIGVLAVIGRLDWFFLFILGPMNVALVLLWLWQRTADARFLSAHG